MKSLKFAALVMLIGWALPAFGQKTYLQASEVPTKIQAFVTNNFAHSDIIYGKKKVKAGTTTYEVKLRNGAEFEFDEQMNPTEMESREPLPQSVIPEEIWKYVAMNYPQNKILEWKKEYNYQKVELNQDIDLYFDFSGKFLKKD